MSDQPRTIDMRPAPHLVQEALDHCNIPLVYSDDHTIDLSTFDDNQMQALLSAVITTAMTKHLEDTMILPTHAACLKSVARDLRQATAIDVDLVIEDALVILERVVESLGRAR